MGVLWFSALCKRFLETNLSDEQAEGLLPPARLMAIAHSVIPIAHSVNEFIIE
jgi:hypothetical protein